MKLKLLALTLALTVLSWAQTATPNPSSDQPAQSSASQETPKADCAGCCKHMADSKDAKGCCHDMHAKAGTQSCCSGKDGKACMGKNAKSCMKGESANASCSTGKCCDMKDAQGCCSHSTADGEKTAMACCSGTECGMDHAHANMSN